MNIKIFKATFLVIFILELASLLPFYYNNLYALFFVLVSVLFALFTWHDLKYGVYGLLIELIIGSKGGDLFYIDLGGQEISIRMSFWVILMSVWLIKHLLPNLLRNQAELIKTYNYKWLKYFGVFGIFVVWGIINALFQNNNLGFIFSDADAYLIYFTIFPLFFLIKETQNKKELYTDAQAVFLAALTWLSFKTLALLYLFSHNIEGLNSFVYHWVRDTGVGEITKMEEGFYRIFFQSHIYVILALAPLFVVTIKRLEKSAYNLKSFFSSGKNLGLLALLLLFFSINIISLSRSNWVGVISASALIVLYFAYLKKFKAVASFLLLTTIMTFLSFALIVSVVKFPYPDPLGSYSTGKLLSDRVNESRDEAAVSSRWNLLGPLKAEIMNAPLMGKGFGETVTYISEDPRAREANPDGLYTSFVLEWGWLDYWLKTGLLGLLSYLLFLGAIVFYHISDIYRKRLNLDLSVALSIMLISLSAIHFFSPYLNHPLGIGMVVFILFFLELEKISLEKENER